MGDTNHTVHVNTAFQSFLLFHLLFNCIYEINRYLLSIIFYHSIYLYLAIIYSANAYIASAIIFAFSINRSIAIYSSGLCSVSSSPGNTHPNATVFGRVLA